MPRREPRETTDAQLQFRRDVGIVIRQLRTDAGLTIEEVARRIGRDRRTVSAWEHGTAAADIDDLAALSPVLGVEPWRFLYG